MTTDTTVTVPTTVTPSFARDIKTILSTAIKLPVSATALCATIIADTGTMALSTIAATPKVIGAVKNSTVEATYGACNYDMELSELRAHIATKRALTLDESLEAMVATAAPAAAKATAAMFAAMNS